jgi:peptide/nickel transport system substrate-binding protein
VETGVSVEMTHKGEFELSVSGIGWPDCMLLWAMFHSDMIGVYNTSRLSDPELDPIVANIVFTNSAEVSEKSCIEAQRYVVEQAYVIPTYAPISFAALSNRVQGAVVSPITGYLYLDTAYVETAPR